MADLVTAALALADCEAERTKLVRAAQQAEQLLADAQHALANGRLAVVDEFVDRALALLRNAH